MNGPAESATAMAAENLRVDFDVTVERSENEPDCYIVAVGAGEVAWTAFARDAVRVYTRVGPGHTMPAVDVHAGTGSPEEAFDVATVVRRRVVDVTPMTVP